MPDKSSMISVIAGVCIAAIWLVLPLRCYVRLLMKKYFGADDVLAIIGTVSFTIACSAMIYGSTHHVWRPWNEIPPTEYERGLKVFFICKVLYGFTTGIIKLSFGITLLRIAKERSHIWALYCVMSTTLAFTIFYLIFILTTCRPTRFYWERAVSNKGHCRPSYEIVIATYVQGFLVFAADLILAIVPVFMVKNVTAMDPLVKVTAICLLALGSVTSIATIARIPYIQRLKDTDNFVYKNIEIAIWSGLELCIGLVATGASTLRPLLSKFNSKSTENTFEKGNNAGHKKSKDTYDSYPGFDAVLNTGMDTRLDEYKEEELELGDVSDFCKERPSISTHSVL